MRYNSYTLFFRRSDDKCYGLEWGGFFKPFKPDKYGYTVQHNSGKYISRPSFDLNPATGTTYTIRVAVREDSEFFNVYLVWSSLWEKLRDSAPIEEAFGEDIQRFYNKEIEEMKASAVEI